MSLSSYDRGEEKQPPGATANPNMVAMDHFERLVMLQSLCDVVVYRNISHFGTTVVEPAAACWVWRQGTRVQQKRYTVHVRTGW